jgi:2-hydroxychromene-2-carboxylate isomerase
MPQTVTWYFDPISPYAYLAWHQLRRLPADIDLRLQPVLFAGLLNHWGQKGPAEIVPKRVWTYRACVWLAQQAGVPFRMPAAHPFNSLPYLRLAIAAGHTPAAVDAIFTALWTTGADPADPALLQGLMRELAVSPAQLADPAVKFSLREATEAAAQAGVFGVPSLVVQGEVFWGADAIDFAAAFIADPGVLASAEMRRIEALPIGAARPGSAAA